MLNQDGESTSSIAVYLAWFLETFDLEHLKQVAILGLDCLLDNVESTLLCIVLNVFDDSLVGILEPQFIRVPRSSLTNIFEAPQPSERSV